ncbi:MAG: hypothetical protein AAGC71_09845 [Pseudomonadota bacterium]
MTSFRSVPLILLVLPAIAAADFSVGAKVSTAGTGIEGYYHFDRQFAFRIGLGQFTYNDVRDISGINYDYSLTVTGATVLLDIAPRGGNFYVTGGIFVNGNEFEADAELIDTITVGNTTYTAADVGELSGTVTFNPISPYVGLGYRWRAGEPGLSIGIEGGLLFQGQGDVDLLANGPITDTPGFQQDLVRETDELEDKLGIAKVYPVIELRAAYRFR